MTAIPPPAAPAAPVIFHNGRGAFLRLLIRGAGLQLVTFGFYRFWLLTDIRRHLWSHTQVEGDGFEYTGRATELLIGFLIALAILVPIYVVYFLLGLAAEELQAFASIPLFFILYVFGHFAIYRARRYRLSRTVWRGIRFWVDGSGFAYAGRVLLWSPLVLLTAGLIYPWRTASLERYKMAHTHFGDQRGAFSATGGQLFRRIWWLIAILIVALVAYVGAFAWLVSVGARRGGDGAVVLLSTLALLAIIALPFILPIYRAIEWRWWADGAQLGVARLSCRLPNSALLKLYLKAIFVGLLVLLAVGMIFAAIAGAIYFGSLGADGLDSVRDMFAGAPEPAHYLLIAIVLAMYLALGLSVGVVQKLYLQHDYWRVVSSSLSVIGLAGLAAAAHAGATPSAVGEGLADSLDVAGF